MNDETRETETGLATTAPTTLATMTPRSSLQYLGQNLESAALFARLMWRAGVGGKEATPQDVLARIMQGLELGLPPMTSIKELFVVDGKCGMSSRLMHALARKNGASIEIVESDATHAVVEITRPGGGTAKRFEWTIDMATKANLLKGRNWQNYPQQMLLSRVVSMAINYTCPEVLGGGMYELDELRDMLPEAVDDGLTVRQRAAQASQDFDDIFSGKRTPRAAKGAKGAKALPAAEPTPTTDEPKALSAEEQDSGPIAATPSDDEEVFPEDAAAAAAVDAPGADPPANGHAAALDEKKPKTAAKPKTEPKATTLDRGSQALAAAMCDAAQSAGLYYLGNQIEVDAKLASACGLDVRVYPVTSLIDMVNAGEILTALRERKIDSAEGEVVRG